MIFFGLWLPDWFRMVEVEDIIYVVGYIVLAKVALTILHRSDPHSYVIIAALLNFHFFLQSRCSCLGR